MKLGRNSSLIKSCYLLEIYLSLKPNCAGMTDFTEESFESAPGNLMLLKMVNSNRIKSCRKFRLLFCRFIDVKVVFGNCNLDHGDGEYRSHTVGSFGDY